MDFSKNSELEKVTKCKLPKAAETIIPGNKVIYLKEIADIVRNYNKRTKERVSLLDDYDAFVRTSQHIDSAELNRLIGQLKSKIGDDVLAAIEKLDKLIAEYRKGGNSVIKLEKKKLK